jgi:hypothetical protein
MAPLVSCEYGGLTERPCDFHLHPVYAGFLNRSGLLLRYLLLFLTYAPQYKGELEEWRATIEELEASDRARGLGEPGRSRKYGTEAGVARKERLPKRFEADLGIDFRDCVTLSYAANMACALYVWYLVRLLRDPHRGIESTHCDLEHAALVTSSAKECARLTELVKDGHPSARLLNLIGARDYRRGAPERVEQIREVLRPYFGRGVDIMTPADIDRSGIAQLFRIYTAAIGIGKRDVP